MGCDIRVVFEEQVWPSQWAKLFSAPLWRDYELFTKLAGVRGNVNDKCISPPRGLPEDVSPETRAELSWSGYHSHSWITWEEFSQWFPASDIREATDFETAFWLARKCVGALERECRVVFAFDS